MGVTFSNAFTNNPVCCPARAGIIPSPQDWVLVLERETNDQTT